MITSSPVTPERLVGVAIAARWIGCCPGSLRAWAIAGKIPSHKTAGGHWRFRKSELYAALGIPGP